MKKLNYFTAIQFLSKYIFKHKRNFIMFYFGWFFDMVLSIAMPIMFGIMIDEIVYYQNLDTFIKISLVFIVMTVFSCILYFFIYAQHHYLMSMYTFDIKKDIFDHLQKCDAEYLTDASSGDIVQTLQHYSGECMHFVIRNIIHFVNGIIAMIAASAYLFIISPIIGLFVIVAAPISVYISAKFGKQIRNYSDKQREYYGTYISWVFEMLSALRDIRMLGAVEKTNKAFVQNHKKMFDVNIKSGISSLTAGHKINFTNLLTQLGIFTFAGYLAMNGNITIGLLTVIVAFFVMLADKIKWSSASFLDAQNRVSYIQRIYDFMQSPTESGGENELCITNGKISFHDIHFAYAKSNTVLDGFSLDIEAGSHFALVGKSGSGKTTLAYMLIGFYKPQSGYIEIDGQSLCDCTLKSIRDQIGIVQQDVLLFDGTIRENLLLGKRSESDSDIINACEHAGIWAFVSSLPQGLDTIVGKNGTGLSGGQKQRIAIARIYLKDPKIIILDEATSSLDSETEEQIHSAWKSVLKGRTSVVIAHRQSSVELCEQAALIENGKVSECSSTSDMVLQSTAFRTLFAVKEEDKC